MQKLRKLSTQGLFALLATLLVTATALAGSGSGLWPSAGQDLSNTRYAKTESEISPVNVSDLVMEWEFQTGGDVSATAAVDGDYVYIPDWAGNLFKLDRETFAEVWTFDVAAATGIPGNFSRTTPASHGNKLIFGDQGGRFFQGARVMAVDKDTGSLLWMTQVESHPASIVTQSPVVHGNQVYVGVSSLEELYAADPYYPCCTFRGSLLALDANTGSVIWQAYMAPDGYSGNSVWGSTPAVDTKRGSVYIATGNNYTVPSDALQCVDDNEGDPDAIQACLDPANHFDSIVALDLSTGETKWAARAIPFDAWTVACIFGGPNCEAPSGPDLDFGQGPMLFSYDGGQGKSDEFVGAGQKSGQFWALDPDTGEVVWFTQAGPGGILGGMMWGSAADGERVYVANTFNGWSALDAQTGEILWNTPDPNGWPTQGAATVANGVVFACSLDPVGTMYGLEAETGAILWSFASGGSCNAGAAVVDGTVYWGSGYTSLAAFYPGITGNDKFFAFTLP